MSWHISGTHKISGKDDGLGPKSSTTTSLVASITSRNVTGQSRSGSNLDYATVKYDSVGNEEWVARYNGEHVSGDTFHTVECDGCLPQWILAPLLPLARIRAVSTLERFAL
ncbi:MAG: hypothetical protein ACR2HJ_03155 [Fimbriimonadales bacterium]